MTHHSGCPNSLPMNPSQASPPRAAVRARTRRCSEHPRATTGEATARLDMPLYISAPISRHAAYHSTVA